MIPTNLTLPRNRATLNSWYRSAVALTPTLHTTTECHVGNMDNIQISNEEPDIVKRQFDIIQGKIPEILREILVAGESFFYLSLDERQGIFSEIIIQNPDYVKAQRDMYGKNITIMLRPDEHLRRIVTSNAEECRLQRSKLSDDIIEWVKTGRDIPLHDWYTYHIRTGSPYEIRGTSYLFPILNKIAENDYDNQEVRDVIMWPFDPVNAVQFKRIKTFYRDITSKLIVAIDDILEKVCKLNDVERVSATTFDIDEAMARFKRE